MTDYVPTIGLEIHAELKTKTKMFCSSRNDPGEKRPNVNICPVCLAHPGTLPVINREAIKHVLKVGLALRGTFADYTEFDRKNYFYPDLPKGYQISQYEYPLVSGGELNGIAITRVHLEEDTASSIHDEEKHATVIDFNRAGIPLMELVTEPVIKGAAEASRFARELQLLLRYLGVGEANMEKGEMRVEANVSISKKAKGKGQKLGTKVEIKNLNSFKAMERAVAHEIERQTKLLVKGERVVQETRGWDEGKQATFTQRTKEGSADYRYFPDPDLPSLRLSEIAEFSPDMLRKDMPELPWDRRERYVKLGLKTEDADAFVREPVLAGYFDSTLPLLPDAEHTKVAANFIANDLVGIIRDIEGRDSDYSSEVRISSADLAEIAQLFLKDMISSRTAKDALSLAARGKIAGIRSYLATQGLIMGGAPGGVEFIAERVMAENPLVVADIRAGKTAAMQYLVGQGMKIAKGATNPSELRSLIEAKLAQLE